MASEHEIKRELEELNADLPEISRRPPFERNDAYLNGLPDRLTEFVQRNAEAEKPHASKRRFSLPLWARGVAAALLFLISGTLLYRWMNPETIERKVSRELRTVDDGSIVSYLQQNPMEVDEFGVSRLATELSAWPTAEQLATVDPKEIETYLNTFPSIEDSQN